MVDNSGSSVLMSHVGDTNKVTREELALIPTPGGTDTFKPVSHIELVKSMEVILEHKGISVLKESFAVRSDGSKMFGTFDLSLDGIDGTTAALGFRTANDKTMKLQLITGLKVTVCDNGLFAGDSIIMNRKHTKGLDLLPELMGAFSLFDTRFAALKDQVSDLAALTLTDNEAKALIHDAFIKDLMPIRYLPNVSHEYFHPRHTEFEARTAFSLHNSFTEVAKDMTLNRRMEAVQGLGELFGLVVS